MFTNTPISTENIESLVEVITSINTSNELTEEETDKIALFLGEGDKDLSANADLFVNNMRMANPKLIRSKQVGGSFMVMLVKSTEGPTTSEVDIPLPTDSSEGSIEEGTDDTTSLEEGPR